MLVVSGDTKHISMKNVTQENNSILFDPYPKFLSYRPASLFEGFGINGSNNIL